MTTRMLIDARHREETRVAVVKGHRIEEFDFESSERKQLKGNIYLAKVTRVEPSLQAAFVDYGGNRHGFLAFSEIHPDYYQIPKEDREALLREEAEHAAEEAALRAAEDADDDDDDDGHLSGDVVLDGEVDGNVEVVERRDDADEEDDSEEGAAPARGPKRGNGDDSAADALRQRRMDLRRRYKIQDVIHRRQVLLVQVVKEERGNKGAALTTYLSLAGRYCVLMPNTTHGGGISRKISNASDRKRLKAIMADLKLPPTMGCIVRTAGLSRTKTEIKRDFDYLARLWDGIRETTLGSSAPALIYGDSDLIKRAIRDIYNREIDEVIVEGEEGYRQAKDFMKLLMPSHARRVQHYSDAVPLFQRNHVEDQLAAMYNPVVQLKSGGYLVINPTEALVSIDINSGRSTREHNIEQTATATNLEAAAEIARQLRLRDMAGLVVIDFIDMDHSSNVRKVEKAMKAALANDRARIQVGRISAFGLMEMSRQRLRTGVLEASTRQCPHCEGTGLVRTASSAGLSALRLLEEEAARGRGSQLRLTSSMEACFYLLNRKRADIAEIEERYGVAIDVQSDGETEGARMNVEVSGPPPAHAPRFSAPIEDADDDDLPLEGEEDEEIGDTAADTREESRDDDDRRSRRRRRRRGRRGRRDDEGETAGDGEDSSDEDANDGVEGGEAEPVEAEADGRGDAEGEEHGEGERKKRRRRGRRGGRRGTEAGTTPAEEAPANTDEPDAAAEALPVAAEAEVAAIEHAEPQSDPQPEPEPAPKTRRRPRARKDAAVVEPVTEAVAEPTVAEPASATPSEPEPEPPAEGASKLKRARRKKAEVAAETPALESVTADPEPEPETIAEAPKPKRTRRKKAEVAEIEPAASDVADAGDAPASAVDAIDAPAPANDANGGPEAASPDDEAPTEAGPPRRGWWQRTFGG